MKNSHPTFVGTTAVCLCVYPPRSADSCLSPIFPLHWFCNAIQSESTYLSWIADSLLTAAFLGKNLMQCLKLYDLWSWSDKKKKNENKTKGKYGSMFRRVFRLFLSIFFVNITVNLVSFCQFPLTKLALGLGHATAAVSFYQLPVTSSSVLES